MELVCDARSVRSFGPQKALLPPLWRTFTDALVMKGASDRGIACAQDCRRTMRALAQVIATRTNEPLSPELFREPRATSTHTPLHLPEHHPHGDVNVTRQNFVRALGYAGCASAQLRFASRDEKTLIELAIKIMVASVTCRRPLQCGHDLRYTVPSMTSEEGIPLVRRLTRARVIDPELSLILQKDHVRWTDWKDRHLLHTVIVVPSRNLVLDGQVHGRTPREQDVVRQFGAQYAGFCQTRTDASHAVALIADPRRLMSFVSTHRLRWMRVLHRPLFNDRQVGSVTQLCFEEDGRIRTVEAVDAYENPRFDGNGAFAILVR